MDNIQERPKQPFILTPFNLGSTNLPTKEEIYDERTMQILGLYDESNTDNEDKSADFNHCIVKTEL